MDALARCPVVTDLRAPIFRTPESWGAQGLWPAAFPPHLHAHSSPCRYQISIPPAMHPQQHPAPKALPAQQPPPHHFPPQQAFKSFVGSEPGTHSHAVTASASFWGRREAEKHSWTLLMNTPFLQPSLTRLWSCFHGDRS